MARFSENTFTEINRAINEAQVKIGHAETEIVSLKRVSLNLAKAIERVEWIDDGDDMGAHCPWCGNCQHSGHTPICQGRNALDLYYERQ